MTRVSECLSKPVSVRGATIIDRAGDDVAELCPCVNGEAVARAINYHDELCDMVESLINDNKSIVIAPAVALLEKARGDANV